MGRPELRRCIGGGNGGDEKLDRRDRFSDCRDEVTTGAAVAEDADPRGEGGVEFDEVWVRASCQE